MARNYSKWTQTTKWKKCKKKINVHFRMLFLRHHTLRLYFIYNWWNQWQLICQHLNIWDFGYHCIATQSLYHFVCSLLPLRRKWPENEDPSTFLHNTKHNIRFFFKHRTPLSQFMITFSRYGLHCANEAAAYNARFTCVDSQTKWNIVIMYYQHLKIILRRRCNF